MNTSKSAVVAKLRAWFKGDTEGNPLRVVALYHMGSEPGEATAVESWLLEAVRGPEEEWYQEQAQAILDSALADCAGLGFDQRYSLFAFFGKNAKPSMRLIVMMSPPLTDGMDDSSKFMVPSQEQSNAKGLVAQAHRQVEMMGKFTMAMVAEGYRHQRMMADQLMEDNERLRSRISAQDRRHQERMTLMEELINQKHLRDMEVQAELESRETRKLIAGQVMQSAAPVLSAVMSGIARKELGPGSPSPEREGLKTIFREMSNDDKEALGNLLQSMSPGTQQAMMAILTPILMEADEDGEK